MLCGIAEIWFNIFDFLAGSEVNCVYDALHLVEIVPKDHIYWRRTVEVILCRSDINEVLFRLGYYNNVNYFDVFTDIFIPRKCSRSGCLKSYVEADQSVCKYHPGKKVRGHLTCCQCASFEEPGCTTIDHHDGSFYRNVHLKREIM